MIALIVRNSVLVLAMMLVLWLISVRRKDVSIVDPFWSIGFLVVTCSTWSGAARSPGNRLLLAMVALWSLRLFAHLFVRAIGKKEDPRYAGFRTRYGAERYWWISLFQVFLLQGTLILLLSAPILFALVRPQREIGSRHVAASLVFLVGFLVEAIADEQLRRFRADPDRGDRILDKGLFRYSRHPNYFGEALVAWSFWMFGAEGSSALLTMLAPIVMTFLLIRVSGVSLLDEHMLRTKPAYAEYMRRTSAFFPWPPSSAPANRAR